MIGDGYSTYCLWQAYSGVEGCPVEVEGSEDEMEADSLGKELHYGDLSGCLHFLFEHLLATFQDILHLPIINDSQWFSEEKTSSNELRSSSS